MENISTLRLLLAAVALFIFVYIFLRGLRVCFLEFLIWLTRDGEDKHFLFWTVQRKR